MRRGQKLNAASPTVMSSPHKSVDEIQPNLVCNVNNFFGPWVMPHIGVLWGQKLNSVRQTVMLSPPEPLDEI